MPPRIAPASIVVPAIVLIRLTNTSRLVATSPVNCRSFQLIPSAAAVIEPPDTLDIRLIFRSSATSLRRIKAPT